MIYVITILRGHSTNLVCQATCISSYAITCFYYYYYCIIMSWQNVKYTLCSHNFLISDWVTSCISLLYIQFCCISYNFGSKIGQIFMISEVRGQHNLSCFAWKSIKGFGPLVGREIKNKVLPLINIVLLYFTCMQRVPPHHESTVSSPAQWRRNLSPWDGSSRPTFKGGTAQIGLSRPTFWQ